MGKWSSKKDPHTQREAEKYDNPVPSREYILDFLEANNEPTNLSQFITAFGLDDDEERKDALRRRLRAMARDGQLMQNRKGAYGLASKMDLILGRVIGHRDGFGFLAPDVGGDDLYLTSHEMRLVFDGDKALARVSGVDRKGRKEGSIVEVTERNTTSVVGRFFTRSGVSYVEPDNKRIAHTIVVAADATGDADDGQFVTVNITEQPQKKVQAQGEVIEVLGDHMAPGMEIDVAMRAHDIPHTWPNEVLAEAAELSAQVTEGDKKHRVDLRDLPLVTIDGEDARDFDDAVYCEKKASGGWRLLVAIADVSHYVAQDSPLDQQAKVRGTSVYFPERVIPMLPEALSNGLCSLNPDVDRLCMVCEMSISAQGKMTRYKFYEGLMRSHARLTYTQVGELIDARKNKSDTPELFLDQHAGVLEPVLGLYELYQALSKQRAERGTIDFETTETRLIFSDDKKIENIVPVVRNEAHRLIEECMLCANVAAAKVLLKYKMPVLYRVHPRPKDEKLAKLKVFLSGLGLEPPGDKPAPAEFQAILKSVSDRPDFSIIQTVMLRSLSQAIYTPENEGHFGLAYDAYTHFTSPIRRYPDLLVHRALRYLVRTEKESANVERVAGAKRIAKKDWIPHSPELMVTLGEHCSMTERRADDATRDVMDWLKCEYMVDHVGECFDGVVSAVTAFGLFVELKDIYVEGLVHVTALKNDYYHFDAERHTLRGERTGNAYSLGDQIAVQVVRVNLDDKKIDFELENPDASNSRKIQRKKKSEKGGKHDKPKADSKGKAGRKENDKSTLKGDNNVPKQTVHKTAPKEKAAKDQSADPSALQQHEEKPANSKPARSENSIWGQAQTRLSKKRSSPEFQAQNKSVDDEAEPESDWLERKASPDKSSANRSERSDAYQSSDKPKQQKTDAKKGGKKPKKRAEKSAAVKKKLKVKKAEAAKKKRSRMDKDKGKRRSKE